MRQKESSIIAENVEIKYKKALIQIQKIHNANKFLKDQSEEMREEYQRQISQLKDALKQHQKQSEFQKEKKAENQKHHQELQIAHSELKKAYNGLQRESAYLNELLIQQNNELKKINAFKNNLNLKDLIISYEDRQVAHQKDISRLEEAVRKFRANYAAMERDLDEQKRQRFALQDLNSGLRMEISKFREFNNNLISKNESIVAALLSRSSEGKEKYREAESMLREFSRQLQLVKNMTIEKFTSSRETVAIESYENVLRQKAKLEDSLLMLRERLQEYQIKARQGLQTEDKLKRALTQIQQLQQQRNILKGRLIIAETKEAMDGSVELSDLKDLQERVLAGITHNDPLIAIKNGSDSSHFQLMKSYIVELKEKLSKALISRKQVDKKYRAIKQKFAEKTQKAVIYEQQNKLLKGKLEGYERLTKRLQFQLQKTLQAHDEEISKIKNTTNAIISKRTEELRVANAYARNQLGLEYDRFQKSQKSMRQEIETLRAELSSQKVKNADLHEKYVEVSEFLQIYQKKFNELTLSNVAKQENNQNLSENVFKFQQLYRQESDKKEAALLQKQKLNIKLEEASEKYDKTKLLVEQLVTKYSEIEAEYKKTKVESEQAKKEILNLQNALKVARKQQEESRKAMQEVSQTDTGYYKGLENDLKEAKEKNKELEAEVQSLKLRLERALYQSQKVYHLQDALNVKNDEITDVKRKNILSQKSITSKEAEIKQYVNQCDILRRENNALKAKLIESELDLKKSSEFKKLQGKKLTQKLNQELTSALSQLREQRRMSSRMQSDLQAYKNENQRLQTLLQQAKSKELNLYEQVSQLRNSQQKANEEVRRLSAEVNFKNGLIDGLNNELNALQQQLYQPKQGSSQIYSQLQLIEKQYGELKRQIIGLKSYLKEVEEYGSRKVEAEKWQERRERQSIWNFAQRIKKMLVKVQGSQNSEQPNSKTLQQGSLPKPADIKKSTQPLFKKFQAAIISPMQSSYAHSNYEDDI